MADRISSQWVWAEGDVDECGDHFKLFYESGAEASALVGRPSGYCFPVQFLSSSYPLRSHIEKQLHFYIIQTKEQDVWACLIQHCRSTANLFSNVHWRFFQGEAGVRQTEGSDLDQPLEASGQLSDSVEP